MYGLHTFLYNVLQYQFKNWIKLNTYIMQEADSSCVNKLTQYKGNILVYIWFKKSSLLT